MKKKSWFSRIASLSMIGAVLLAASCKDEDRLTVEDTLAISEEAIADSYFEDIDDMSSVVVNDTENPSNGRSKGSISSNDERFKCGATITVSDNATQQSGVITVDFGTTGCTVRGNTRQGKVILTYSNGPAGTIGFTIVVTLENYKINGIELKGKRTIKRIEASSEDNIKHEITLEDGEAIWPNNGGTATRESSFVREWIRDQADQRVVLSGNASGSTRRSKSYTMSIDATDPLVYHRACIITEGIYMASEGTKVFNTDSKQIVIDYGDGGCDRSVKITVNGTARNISVGTN